MFHAEYPFLFQLEAEDKHMRMMAYLSYPIRVSQFIFLGTLWHGTSEHVLKILGINTLVDLTSVGVANSSDSMAKGILSDPNFRYFHFPVVCNGSLPLNEAVECIQEHALSDRKLLVFDGGAQNAAGSILVAYYLKVKVWNMNTALAFVANKKKDFKPDASYFSQLNAFNDRLKFGHKTVPDEISVKAELLEMTKTFVQRFPRPKLPLMFPEWSSLCFENVDKEHLNIIKLILKNKVSADDPKIVESFLYLLNSGFNSTNEDKTVLCDTLNILGACVNCPETLMVFIEAAKEYLKLSKSTAILIEVMIFVIQSADYWSHRFLFVGKILGILHSNNKITPYDYDSSNDELFRKLLKTIRKEMDEAGALELIGISYILSTLLCCCAPELIEEDICLLMMELITLIGKGENKEINRSAMIIATTSLSIGYLNMPDKSHVDLSKYRNYNEFVNSLNELKDFWFKEDPTNYDSIINGKTDTDEDGLPICGSDALRLLLIQINML
eukprot:GHVL01024089.1.p1 GENE.GHVL01024089.1~~GHVL01024089.1.p1  ORF type:complete len:499 (+),score=50.48 GHVL01024089.1:418-1914(+)